MATGTTSNYTLTRNDIIASAMRKVKGWPSDGNPPLHKLRDAVRALNLMMRAEALKRRGLEQALWAKTTFYLDLTAARFLYDNTSDSVPIMTDIESAFYRNTNGDDEEIDIYTEKQYEAIPDKTDTSGAPEGIYVKRDRTQAPTIYVWPTFSSLTAGDTVYLSSVEYLCIKTHTSSSENQPGSGTSAGLYWKTIGATAESDSWATATDYDNGPLIVLNYSRPLYDFDNATDNPDIPLGWEDYLIYKLALRLAPEYDISAEARQMLRQDLAQIEADIWPSERQITNKKHNFAEYF